MEILLPADQRSTALVKRFPDVASALNNEVRIVSGKNHAVAIKEKADTQFYNLYKTFQSCWIAVAIRPKISDSFLDGNQKNVRKAQRVKQNVAE